MTGTTTFDPDVLRKEFADYCTEVEPGIKAKAPRLNQLETLALIGMTLFQAAKDLKAERAQLADEVSGLRAARIAYASEFAPDAEGLPDVGNIHANIRALKSQIATVAPAVDAQPVAWLCEPNGWNGFPQLEFSTEHLSDDKWKKVPLYASTQSEGLRKDAERYRWLRDKGDLSVRDVFGSWNPHLNDGLDAAIDAALSQHKAGEKDD